MVLLAPLEFGSEEVSAKAPLPLDVVDDVNVKLVTVLVWLMPDVVYHLDEHHIEKTWLLCLFEMCWLQSMDRRQSKAQANQRYWPRVPKVEEQGVGRFGLEPRLAEVIVYLIIIKSVESLV